MKIHICFKCGHEWATRTQENPKRCANCKSRTWMLDKPKQIKHDRSEMDSLEIGENVLVPWPDIGKSYVDFVGRSNLSSTLKRRAKKIGIKIWIFGSRAGLTIRRVQ